MDREKTLAGRLRAYADSGMLPMHMPGHKRKVPREILEQMRDVYELDLTEVEGTDDLHHSRGILKEAMDHAAELWGAKKSFFLINGSSCGVLAAIHACLMRAKEGGGEKKYALAAAQNVHFSARHAMELLGLEEISLPLGRFPDTGIFLPPSLPTLEEILRRETGKGKNIIGVFITSPGYEGVGADIPAFSRVCKAYRIPLIVDEAHGAHLLFFKKEGVKENFPDTAIRQGGDLVIQSLHKTLPSPTQTALLHLANKEWIPYGARALRIFETGSPSYILMAGMDACIRYMEGAGKEIQNYIQRLKAFQEKMKNLRYLRLWQPPGEEISFDFCKLIVPAPDFSLKYKEFNGIIDGRALAGILRRDYKIETEMALTGYVLAMSTLCDGREDLDRLFFALKDLDDRLGRAFSQGEGALRELVFQKRPSPVLESLRGQRAREDIILYPPGIVLVKKGQVVDDNTCKQLLELQKKGANLYGIPD